MNDINECDAPGLCRLSMMVTIAKQFGIGRPTEGSHAAIGAGPQKANLKMHHGGSMRTL